MDATTKGYIELARKGIFLEGKDYLKIRRALQRRDIAEKDRKELEKGLNAAVKFLKTGWVIHLPDYDPDVYIEFLDRIFDKLVETHSLDKIDDMDSFKDEEE